MTSSSNPPLPWADSPYSIKQHGLTITNCDREPVQTPGCIQAHGALLVVEADTLRLIQISENAEAHLGTEPQALLGSSLATLLSPQIAQQVADSAAAGRLESSPMLVSTWHSPTTQNSYDVIVHTVGELVLVELVPAVAAPDSINYYDLVKAAMRRLEHASSLAEFADLLTREVRHITGLDRAMVYRFHADFHGEVFAEAKREDLPSWKGLHYPAEDIPQPARDIFRQIWLRPVPDIDGALAEMVPLANPSTGRGLTMTHCVLRGPSVMYTEYLRNMGVTAAVTLSLRDGDKLWGMVACHHYDGPKALNVHARSACELLAQVASLLIRKIEEREHLQQRLEIDNVHQQVLARAALNGDLRLLLDGTPSLLDGIPCGGVALRFHGRWWRVGQTPDEASLDALAAWLVLRPELADPVRPLFETDSLSRDYPAAADFASVASGLLAVPLGDSRFGLLLWMRPETLQTVNWAGNPHDKPQVAGPLGMRLTPRASFDLFVESVRQRALPWEPVHGAAASRLRMLIQNIVISHAEQIARLNSELTESNDELDSFAHIASHDLKEPLRGIHKYAHQLLTETAVASEEGRAKLDRLMRLTGRMDALLNSLMHYSRVGRTQLYREDVDLNELVVEAREALVAMIAERPYLEIHLPRPLPVHNCDPVRVREVFTNLLSNALKYSPSAGTIEIGFHGAEEVGRPGAMPAQAAGQVIFYVKDQGLGIGPQYFEAIFALFRRLHGRDMYGGGTGAGLTIVKRVVERHGGVVWVSSQEGQGSTFCFTLPHPPSPPPTNPHQTDAWRPTV